MKTPFFILIFILLSAPCGWAQSGRLKPPPASPSPSPSPASAEKRSTPTATASPSPLAKPEASPTEDAAPKFHPHAFIVMGRTIIVGGKSFWRSDDVKVVADEIKFIWDLERAPVKVIKGGKTTRKKAVAQAKQETESYVLYIEIHVTIRGLAESVDRIDYVLLMPGTGDAVRQFKASPGSIVQMNDSGARLPQRTQGHSNDYYVQLRLCAWDMARVLRYWL